MKKKLLIIGIVVFLISSCKYFVEYFNEIWFYNNTKHSIAYYFALGGKYGTYHPDNLPDTAAYLFRDIKSTDSTCILTRRTWEDFFKDFPSDTLSIYIFHTDTLDKYSWKEICEDYLVLKRYDLSLYDLKKLKFQVPYPPSQTMYPWVEPDFFVYLLMISH